MAYDKEKLFQKILNLIDELDLNNISQVCAYAGINRSHFYTIYPEGTNENNIIKEKLQDCKTKNVHYVTKQWKDSDNPTLQIAYVKLNSNDEDRRKLSNSYIEKSEINVNGQGTSFNITRRIISDESETD